MNNNINFQTIKIFQKKIVIYSFAVTAVVILGGVSFYQEKRIRTLESRLENLTSSTAQNRSCQTENNFLLKFNSVSSDSKDNYILLTLKEAIDLAKQNNKQIKRFGASKNQPLPQEIYDQVVHDYYNLQLTDEQLKIEQEQLKFTTSMVRDERLLEQAGLGTKFHVLSAQIIKEKQQSILNSAIAAQKLAKVKLAETLNLKQAKEPRINDQFKKVGSWNLSLAESFSLATKNAEKRQTSINTKGYQIDNFCQKLRLEVANAFFSYTIANKNVEILRKSLEHSRENLKLARLRYQARVGTQSIVLSASNNYRDAQQNYVNAIINYNLSIEKLRLITGELLD
ncbi:MAG TPA: hypothetical protein DCF68_16595 [Cyanothece sp. UBA12306]|nr:hypothetical protein [Cyanothece sp. UBA12306]